MRSNSFWVSKDETEIPGKIVVASIFVSCFFFGFLWFLLLLRSEIKISCNKNNRKKSSYFSA